MNKLERNLFLQLEKQKSMIKKNNRFFFYNIDSMDYNIERNELKIVGWGFSTFDKSKLKFSLLETAYNKSARFRRINREDVNDAHNIPKNEKLGFEILIPTKHDINSLWIVFKNNDNIILPVKIDKKNIGKYSITQYIKNAIKSANNIGIKNTIYQLKAQGRNIWNDYDLWIFQNETFSVDKIKKEIESFSIKPKISIVVPVYNVDEVWLRRNIESVRNQSYDNWELCLADDCSPAPHIKRVLNEYIKSDSRIKVVFREKNGHISRATNSALKMATGDFIGFMDNDDELAPNALFEYVKTINKYPDAEFLYCDEDMIDMKGRRFNPFFKSSWNEKLLLGHNYITHFVVVKSTLMDKVGLLRPEVNGSQDYDFVLRATEKTDKIFHISKILYHWRTIVGSVAENPEAKNYAYISGKKALEDALFRRRIKGTVEIGKEYGTYKLDYLEDKKPFVSIIIVNYFHKNNLAELMIHNLLLQTDYPDYEIILINFEEINGIKSDKIRYEYNTAKRNYNQLRNFGASKARGDFLVFIDMGMELKSKDWLYELVNEGLYPGVGIVGCKILDCDGRVLNAGMRFEDDFSGIHYSHYGCTNDNIGYYYRLALPQYVFAVSNKCCLIQKDVFDSVDGFSKEYSGDLSAIDFCLKIREQNCNVVWTPYSVCQSLENNEIMLKRDEMNSFEQKWNLDMLIDCYTNVNIKDKY